MPPKRKAPTAPKSGEDVQTDTKQNNKAQKTNKFDASATDKKQKQTDDEKVVAKKAPPQKQQPADFGAAFASLLAEPAPKKASTAPSETAVNDKTTKDKTNPKDQKNDNKNKKSTVVKGKDDKKPTQTSKKDALGRTEKELNAATSAFQQAKEKQREKRRLEAEKQREQMEIEKQKKKADTQVVATASRNDAELKMKEKLAQQQKQKEKERTLLFEKDHIKPEYNDLEKKLQRVATKGVVTLFNAVYEQQKKIEEIRANKSLLSGQKDQMIDDEAQQGFLQLLKQSTQKGGAAVDYEAIVPTSRKQISAKDIKKKKLLDADELDYDDIQDILGSDDETPSDITESDSEEVAPSVKAGSKAKQQQQQQQKGKKPLAKVPDFLEDDYMMKKRTMKDWENDSDSSDEDL